MCPWMRVSTKQINGHAADFAVFDMIKSAIQVNEGYVMEQNL